MKVFVCLFSGNADRRMLRGAAANASVAIPPFCLPVPPTRPSSVRLHGKNQRRRLKSRILFSRARARSQIGEDKFDTFTAEIKVTKVNLDSRSEWTYRP